MQRLSPHLDTNTQTDRQTDRSQLYIYIDIYIYIWEMVDIVDNISVFKNVRQLSIKDNRYVGKLSSLF